MKKSALAATRSARRQAARRWAAVKWIVLAGVVALVVYGLSLTGGVAYTEADLREISFSSLNPDQKQTVLEAANRARCNCGCGMNLAQCVATDMTCPVRDDNITRIRVMVEQARQ